MGSHSSTPARNGGAGDPICHCGFRMQKTSSWTNYNPGRRFYACPAYVDDRSCGYFEWFDPPMCKRSKVVIPSLLKKKNALEHQNKMLKIVVGFLVMSWIIYLALWALTSQKSTANGYAKRTMMLN